MFRPNYKKASSPVSRSGAGPGECRFLDSKHELLREPLLWRGVSLRSLSSFLFSLYKVEVLKWLRSPPGFRESVQSHIAHRNDGTKKRNSSLFQYKWSCGRPWRRQIHRSSGKKKKAAHQYDRTRTAVLECETIGTSLFLHINCSYVFLSCLKFPENTYRASNILNVFFPKAAVDWKAMISACARTGPKTRRTFKRYFPLV